MVKYLRYVFALYLHMGTVTYDHPVWVGINEDFNSTNITQVIKEALSFCAGITIVLLLLHAKAAPLKFTGMKCEKSNSLCKYCL